ncbi:hypothetical protein ABFT80_26720 [Mesorhizobium sp. SB112]|uniref:hypothetical protein n=1 Tax=Mesorhizobium sp. SB112 TaxID=3151853 RepID=UPI0032666F09
MIDVDTAILNLDGIPSQQPRKDGIPYFSFDPQGVWRLSGGSHLYDIEDVCVRLHEALKEAIMKGVDYTRLVYAVPQFASMAGHNSEANLTRELFERSCVRRKIFQRSIASFIFMTASTLLHPSRNVQRKSSRSWANFISPSIWRVFSIRR